VQLDGLEDELKCLRETGAGSLYQMIRLPEGMAPSSADVIASLNEHLVVALQVLTSVSLASLFVRLMPCRFSRLSIS